MRVAYADPPYPDPDEPWVADHIRCRRCGADLGAAEHPGFDRAHQHLDEDAWRRWLDDLATGVGWHRSGNLDDPDVTWICPGCVRKLETAP